MNLAIDIGNTFVKAALFDGDRLVRRCDIDEPADRKIFVSTGGREVAGAMKFDHTTPIPIKNLYATPQTLGGDRLAAAVGAWSLFPDENLLVVDFGTAITFDVVAERAFHGGNISAGAAMRFRALNEFTEKLPLVALSAADLQCKSMNFPATDTVSAIRSGVVEGIVAEVERYVARAERQFGPMRVVFTGGDAGYFAERVNFPIFVASELVLSGLNVILNYNA